MFQPCLMRYGEDGYLFVRVSFGSPHLLLVHKLVVVSWPPLCFFTFRMALPQVLRQWERRCLHLFVALRAPQTITTTGRGRGRVCPIATASATFPRSRFLGVAVATMSSLPAAASQPQRRWFVFPAAVLIFILAFVFFLVGSFTIMVTSVSSCVTPITATTISVKGNQWRYWLVLVERER